MKLAQAREQVNLYWTYLSYSTCRFLAGQTGKGMENRIGETLGDAGKIYGMHLKHHRPKENQ
jgi:hypothetical protein